MKITDDYQAKYRIWARGGKVQRVPTLADIPRFPSQKFSSYEEFNAWKREFLRRLSTEGKLRWTK